MATANVGASSRAKDVRSSSSETKSVKPVLHLTDARLDFRRSVPLRISYIIASSYRCGSTFLCTELWRTGLLGAPWEYFNPRKGVKADSIQDAMMKRLKASSLEDYLARLIASRTTRNGVFGFKVHFHDFEATLKRYPGMLDALAPVTYIFMDRRDKLAQAVSMARAMQTNSWISLAKPDLQKLHYDRDLISQCLGKHEMQRLGWQRWFEAHDVNPLIVVYEEMMVNPTGVVRSIVEYMDVQGDAANAIHLPMVEKQADDTNLEWVARFKREVEGGVVSQDKLETAIQVASAAARPAAIAGGTITVKPADNPMDDTPEARITGTEVSPGEHFFDRYSQLARGEHPRPLRMRRRYDVIIGCNRKIFQNARVLDIGSGDGVWSLATLDAGATRVVGIEPKKKRAEAASARLVQLGFKPGSFEFINQQAFRALQRFGPDEFDVILSTNLFEQAESRYFFDQMRRLRPKHVILDTAVIPSPNAVIQFSLRQRDDSAPPRTPLSAFIQATPSHELIALFCDVYNFRWEMIDVQDMGITDWTGFHDYERKRRRTYVLELAT